MEALYIFIGFLIGLCAGIFIGWRHHKPIRKDTIYGPRNPADHIRDLEMENDEYTFGHDVKNYHMDGEGDL